MTLAALADPAQAAIIPHQSPLFLATSAQPNIMLMLDNSGSMVNIVPEAPYSSSTTYSCASPLNITGAVVGPASSTNLPTNSTISKTNGKSAEFSWSGTTYTFGTSNCFDPNKIYNADLAESSANLSADSVYAGNYLNWFFNTNYGSFDNNGRKTSSGAIIAPSRIEVAKTASNNLVNSLNNVRFGLSTYNSDATGGILLAPIDNIATNKSTITTAITGVYASGYTPLAETLSDIGGYFALPYTTAPLTLHPGKTNQATATVADIFNNHTISAAPGVTLPSSSCATANPPTCPIQYSCQKSFAVLVTDGMPTQDRSISSYLKDYDGDCSGANTSNCNHTPFVSDPDCSSAAACDMKTNGVYEDGGSPPGGYLPSDFLDDVAQALYEMDLRPDLTKTAGQKNNVTTYTIGLADLQVQNNPLIRDAATQGGGQFIYAEDSAGLTTALQSTFSNIATKNASASAVAANSTRLDTSTVIYQAKFDSSDWSGRLLAYDINNTEDTNGNGVLDLGEDINSNSVLDTANDTIGIQLWDASSQMPTTAAAAANRKIVTYNPSVSAPRGRDFSWSNLSTTQQTKLNTPSITGITDVGKKRVDYLRGDPSQEQPAGPFRKRTNRLGDIVNSDPWFVGSENYGYDSLPNPEGSSYTTFRSSTSYKQRRRMIYVGANDGMLHGFDAGSYNSSTSTFNSGTGAEKLAYIPDAVIPNLSNLTNPNYTHQYLVDGPPRASDAYINVGGGTQWRTVLLGTTGAGGKAVFALDVTDPDNFSASNVLWEISTMTSPVDTDRTTDNASIAGFQNNLGYTLPQATLARMYNGQWAAIVANGYGSTNNRAVLYIINAENGNLIRSIDTGVGSSTTPNGLSTPIAVDIDNDRITDYIYAGDLLGNLWKFDVTSSNASSWGVAYRSGSTPKPLYTAKDPSNAAQPITAKPQTGRVGGPPQSGGVMVYFGTGKYFEYGDRSTTQTQTFYGIWDICDKNSVSTCDGQVPQVSGRGNLQAQTILQEFTPLNSTFSLRVTLI
jgi:type IV pilus assembly protein PilY1